MSTQILGKHPGSVKMEPTLWNEAVVRATNGGATLRSFVNRRAFSGSSRRQVNVGLSETS